MTSAQRVHALLRNEPVNKIPFTIYESKLIGLPYEIKMRERGICMVKRISTASYSCPNITSHTDAFEYDGKLRYRHCITTPRGDLTYVTEPQKTTSWTVEHMFKSPDDYKKLEFWFKDRIISENYNYADALKADREARDIVVRDDISLEPLQEIIMTMGTNEFCIEWMDNRDEILKLYDILCEKRRKVYEIVAQSPFRFSNYGGNVTPSVIGREAFEKYYMPVYEEACEVFHRYGKKIGCHLDADNTVIMDLVAKTNLDYIEAYDAGISPPLAEASNIWKDKLIWLNWPSGWQFHSYEEIIADTKTLIDSVKDKNKLIIGITEDIPHTIQEKNLNAILDAVELYGGIL